MSAAVLPASRLGRRRPRTGRWSLAIAAALAANAALIAVLARSAPVAGSDPLPTAGPLAIAAPPEPPPAAPAVATASPVPAVATDPAPLPALPALPAPALPAAALAAPAPDGWLAGLGTATGASGPGGGALPAAPAWDEPPRPLDTFDLVRFYPRKQLLRGEGATVTVQVVVATDGTVSDARVVANDGHPAFAEASLRLVRGVAWKAARSGGTPVAGEVVQAIVWQVPR